MGVIGIKLDEGDEVVAMQLDIQGEYLLIVSENGLGKRTLISEFHPQNRNGKGLKCYKITEKTGKVIGAKAVNEDDEIMMITNEGIVIRTDCASISVLKRITSGVKLMHVDSENGIKVANIAKVREQVRADQEDQEEQVESDEENPSDGMQKHIHCSVVISETPGWYASHTNSIPVEKKMALLKTIVGYANRGGNVEIKAYGVENIPSEGSFMFFPNHQGLYDVLAMIETSSLFFLWL